ncbi:MAG: apolipoprotein N-acyltransferase [Gammaproteobacteria bacterium]|nr:apolipoprotein N-acyltransferase [Gammaproteobacteria bacterium]
MITVLAAALSGIMFYLSQGFDNVWALAWFAPVPLLWLAYGKTSTWRVMAASAVAILASAGYLLQSPYLHLIPPLVITSALVVYTGLFCAAVWFARFVQRRASPFLALLAFPACWTGCEFLMELASPNGTYGSFAYSAMAAPVLIQSASLFGMYAVTFLMCLFGNSLAMALRPERETAAAAGVGLMICAVNVVFGIVRLARPQHEMLRVAGIVDETAVAQSWRAHSLSADLAVAETYAREVRLAARQGARFVVTPEGGMASIPEVQSAIIAPLVAASRDTGAQIIAGFHSERPPADFALSITPDGRAQRYDKRHPVPGLEDSYAPGRASGGLGHGRAVEICKDMDFPDTIRPDAANGVRLMGVPAGDMGIDGWQHGIMSVMRGVENGFALVRPAHDGLVFASDAQGRLVALEKDAPTGLTMLVANLPLGSGPTLYTRIGNVFPWICVIFTLAIGAGLALMRSGVSGSDGPSRQPFFFRRGLSGSSSPPTS